MELKEAIRGRRSIRKYMEKAIPQEVLQEILENTRFAPSAMNRQPWYFTVIQSPERLAELKTIMEEASVLEKEKLERTFPSHPQVVRDTRTFIETLGGAPVVILAFLPKDYGDQTYSMVQSIAAAIQNFCILAYEKGIGSCWLTGHLKVEKKIRECFGEGKGECVALLTVGYAQKEVSCPKRHENFYEFI